MTSSFRQVAPPALNTSDKQRVRCRSAYNRFAPFPPVAPALLAHSLFQNERCADLILQPGDLMLHVAPCMQACPGLIPEGLSLAHTTVEEYCGRFVEQLQLVLRECPPEEHSPQAVNLLVAVAEMQR